MTFSILASGIYSVFVGLGFTRPILEVSAEAISASCQLSRTEKYRSDRTSS